MAPKKRKKSSSEKQSDSDVSCSQKKNKPTDSRTVSEAPAKKVGLMAHGFFKAKHAKDFNLDDDEFKDVIDLAKRLNVLSVPSEEEEARVLCLKDEIADVKRNIGSEKNDATVMQLGARGELLQEELKKLKGEIAEKQNLIQKVKIVRDKANKARLYWDNLGASPMNYARWTWLAISASVWCTDTDLHPTLPDTLIPA